MLNQLSESWFMDSSRENNANLYNCNIATFFKFVKIVPLLYRVKNLLKNMAP